MSDAHGPEGTQQPSEEEVRAYLSQLRAAPAEQVVAEVLQGLLNAAQVKLGRKDARLLIDLAAAVTDRARAQLSSDLSGQADQALTQLRLAQVEAEKEVAEAAAQGHQEPNDLGAAPAGAGQAAGAGDAAGAGQTSGAGETQDAGSATAPPSSPPPQRPGQDAASRLWIPGR